MRENLMSGSMWQGMKTRHGDGTEALSEEMESNGSTIPKSRRHPLTLLCPDKSHRTCGRCRCRLLAGREASPVLVRVRPPDSRPCGDVVG